MLIVLLHLSTIIVWIINVDGAKKNRLDKYLYHHSERNLTASNFLLAALLKWQLISTSAIYYVLFKVIYLLMM